jgi:tRNA U34 5-methylaminomethyl-2-thiouridine-forming methyltransferase MnmC
MNVKLEITGDGSHTLSVLDMNEHYHSVHGAISESRHIFIEAGLKYILPEKEKINILEIGFGTGLNALLAFIELSKLNIPCEYTTIEAYPLEEKIFSKLNYPELLNIPAKHFISMHRSEWNKKVKISPTFELHKIQCKVQDIQLKENYFDVVFFDAFAPDIQPEVWAEEIFKTIFSSMKNNSVLTTYSTKGTVKRTLKNIGFIIEKLPGPKGKREILRATKISNIDTRILK